MSGDEQATQYIESALKKERAIRYIELSLKWRRAARERALADSDISADLGVPISKIELDTVVDQSACIQRLEEVLEVLRSAP